MLTAPSSCNHSLEANVYFLVSLRRCVSLACIVVMVSCSHAHQTGQSAPTVPVALEPGWTRVEGGPGTTCALGTPYAFLYQMGDPREVMIYFQGGGVCWDATTCDPAGRLYKPVVGRNERPFDGGMLSLTNADNPVHEYTKVFVPYCTGDFHLGARTVVYNAPATATDSARRFEIHHNGVANAQAALDWLFAHATAPEVVLVAGASSGSVPTPVYAVAVARHYPRARVIALGDGSGSFAEASGIGTVFGGLPFLRALDLLSGLDSATLTYPSLSAAAVKSSPRIAYAEINSADDTTQSFYLRTANRSTPSVSVLLGRNYTELKRALPRFRSYTWPGATHTILPRGLFYTVAVDGVRVRDWVDSLLKGTTVSDVGSSLLTPK